MSGESQLIGTQMPVLSPADVVGMKAFWEVYDAHFDAMQIEVLRVVERLPDLAAILRRMPEKEMAVQNARSRDAMHRAIHEGEWKELLEMQQGQGAVYAAMGVRFQEWFELISAFKNALVPRMVSSLAGDPDRLSSALVGMTRYVDISMSVIGEAYLRTKEKRIEQQQDAIQELSTPVLKVRDRLLLLPIIGSLDTQRARLLTEQLLRAIRAERAKVVVMDITGVPAVDSKVANHLLQTVVAAKLMGAKVVITGLSAEVAQAVVTLGVDLEALNTVGDLQGGLEEAEHILGYRVLLNADGPTATARA